MAGIEPALAPWHGAVLPLHHIHVEPSARFELAAFPEPGGRSTAGATKARFAGEPGFGPELREPKSRGLPITPFPIRAPDRNRTCGRRLTKAPLYRLSYW